MLCLIWSLALLIALVVYLRTIYTKFEKRGVKTDPVVPFFGSMLKIVLRMEHLLHTYSRVYFKYPDERFVGIYEFTKPVILIRDLDLIKRITIKDFEHFLDHRIALNDETDPLFSRTVFVMRGQDWKDMRSTLSPAFTSAKMRMMVPFMMEVGDQMILNLKKTMNESGVSYMDMDIKDLATRFTCDVIASCAFGLKVDSYSNKNNEFYTKGRYATSFKMKQMLAFILSSSVPWLMNLLKLKFFDDEIESYLRGLFTSTMRNREKNNIIRPDMIHLLMEAKKGKLSYDENSHNTDAGFATVEESNIGKRTITRVWKDDDFIAQAVIFLVAGLESVASVAAFLLYELAVNPDVQDKLVAEIMETEATNEGKFNFNTVQQMSYMDMVVSELLRKYPPGPVLDRICTKDYNLGKPNDKATDDYIIHKGEGLQIPVWAIHHDPKYYPDPEKFDPERFSDENKHNINPIAYTPFGLGPRNCIGSRFALCEMKVMVYQILRHMIVAPCPRTVIPAEIEPGSINVVMKGGHWLRLEARNSEYGSAHNRMGFSSIK